MRDQEDLHRRYRLAEYARFDWRQDTGELTFSDDGGPRVVADFQFVGSLATRAATWRWSWANDTILPRVKQELLRVLDFGKTHNLPPILEPEWGASEADAWDMTALATHLLKAKGAYRAPASDGSSLNFLVLTRVAWAPGARR